MTVGDMGPAIAPKSDQLNADDLLAGPITVTISGTHVNPDSEQPAVMQLAERPGRPYKPGKSMSRVLVAAWGPDSSKYVGRRLTLYRDPEVKFGGILVGGIRISHMSDLKRPLKVALTVTRGRKGMFTVQPLVDEAPVSSVTAEDVAATVDVDLLREWWGAASPDIQALIEARVQRIQEAGEDQ